MKSTIIRMRAVLRVVALAFAVGSVFPASVGATLITFDDYPAVPQGNGAADAVTTITSGGYDFAATHSFHILVDPSLCAAPSECVENGTHYASLDPLRSAPARGGSVTMSKHGGGTFSLLQFDGAELFIANTGFENARTISVVGYKSGGAVLYSLFDLDGIKDGPGPLSDFQTFSVDSGVCASVGVATCEWTDLVSVEFMGSRSGFVSDGNAAIDNIVAVASVPEPATLLLLGCSLAGLGWSRRRI